MQWKSGFARDGEQMQHRVGRAPGAGDSGNGVLKGGAGENAARQNALLQNIHDDLAAAEGDFVFARIHGGNAVESHGRKADQLHHRGHGVGGVLAAAGARPGAGNIFQLEQIGVRHLTGGVGAHGFEDILNGDVFAFVNPRGDRAAVEHETRQVQARQRHAGGGNGLVAAHHTNYGVEHLAAADQFDGIRNQLAAHQRGPHALGAHGFAVGDGDGVELHRRAAGGANAFFHLRREAAQVEVAGHGFDPGVGHSDDGAAEVGVGESDGFEHGAGRSLIAPVGDAATAVFEVHDFRRVRL